MIQFKVGSYEFELHEVQDVATMLGTGRYFIYDEVRRGKLRATRIGKKLLFTPQEIARYVDSCQENPQSSETPQKKPRETRPDKARVHEAFVEMGRAARAKMRASNGRL